MNSNAQDATVSPGPPSSPVEIVFFGLGAVGSSLLEELARLFPRSRVDEVRRDLVAWDINLFESVRDAESD